MKSRAFANRSGKPKNSDLPAEINYYLCMHERKKGKKISQELIREQLCSVMVKQK